MNAYGALFWHMWYWKCDVAYTFAVLWTSRMMWHWVFPVCKPWPCYFDRCDYKDMALVWSQLLWSLSVFLFLQFFLFYLCHLAIRLSIYLISFKNSSSPISSILFCDIFYIYIYIYIYFHFIDPTISPQGWI
jgi:hypothetical protein